MKKYIETKSQKEVIKTLEDHGIRVIMKPIALIPDNFNIERFGQESVGNQEMDIYEALKMIKNRSRVVKDPFS